MNRSSFVRPEYTANALGIIVRRVKCDEAKPNCRRCTSTGRKCDGYQNPDQAQSRSSSATPNPESEASVVPARQKIPISRLVKGPVFAIDGDEQEKRAFHFFRERTIPGLCGFFGSDIWERLVLQATFQEPALRHAVFALGSLHERFEMGDRTVFASNLDTVQGGLALRQYTQAINHVIRRSTSKDSRSLDVCLIACILFACFEVSEIGLHHAYRDLSAD